MRAHGTRTYGVVLLAVGLAALAACGGGSGGDGPEGGAGSARAVVQAHIDASRRYDLAGTCELLTPTKREQMASFDGTEAEGYCERATRSIEDSADDETRARSRAIYTDAKVTRLDRTDGTWFHVRSVGDDYTEDVEVTRVDGRWWIVQVESDVDEADDHDH
ncbi:hypothetical protein BH10ACT1_BH10ACT1_08880 [soil metagenome]